MRITLVSGGRSRAVDLVASPRAVLADLVTAVDAPRTDHVLVDGRPVPVDHGLDEAGLADGARVVLGAAGSAPSPLAPPPRSVAPRLVVCTGPRAGSEVWVDRPVVVGEDVGASLQLSAPGVAAAHLRVEPVGGGLRAVPRSGGGSTRVDGRLLDAPAPLAVGAVLQCGEVALRVAPPVPHDRPRCAAVGAGAPFNRPPRAAPPPGPGSVAVPAAAAATTTVQPFPWLAALLPVLLGAVLVATTGSWRFGLFLLLGPVLLVGSWWTQTRRARREGHATSRERAAALAVLRDGLAAAAAAERARRWALHADPAEVVRRARVPSARLWERRTGHADNLRLLAGVCDLPWAPPLDGRAADAGADVAAVLAAHRGLPAVPATVDLSDGGVVGIVGDAPAARALARALVVQAAVHHGPADLELAVVADAPRVADWWWCTWLPHGRAGDGSRRLAVAGPPGTALLDRLGAAPREAGGPTLLLVVDGVEHLRGRGAAARAVLAGRAGPVAGVVLAPSVDQLPAVCDTVLEVADAHRGLVVRGAEAGGTFAPVACGRAEATAVGRALARHDDPEVADGAARLPRTVGLPDLLAPGWDVPDGVAEAWAVAAAAVDVLDVPLGVGPGGPVVVDLVADGPHGLLGGTTGSGKSELLRTLVAGLAARHAPDRCTFLLVDYKGGAAFDACADLPHVVGLVTDLDEHLAARALASLDAELRHREQRLRAAGVTDLAQWQRLPVERRGAALPRLVVVVDEFATLRAELPGFVDALVGVAQRGRSLGVHLLLGTQRPAGAISEDVRANTTLRVALRTTDERDGLDVVGVPDPAAIPADLPGRGVLRRGPGEPVALQTALVTGATGAAATVRVRPVRFDAGPAAADAAPGPGDDRTDLARLVDACRAAAADRPAPRSPMLPPLPASVPLDELLDEALDAPPARPGVLPTGLVDLPDQQRRVVDGWDPSTGTLLVHGTVGSGRTTTLATVVLAAARTWSPDACHVQVLDLGRGGLAPLAALPHVGSVVPARDEERRTRLLADLLVEADRRRCRTAAELLDEPLLLLVVDRLDALLDELDTPHGHELEAGLVRLLTDAPGLRCAVAATTARVGGLRPAVVATAAERWAHRLADDADLALLGLRPADVPALGPGRLVRGRDGRLAQVAAPVDLTAAVRRAAARWPAPARPASAVRVLPDHVPVDRLDGVARVGDGPWTLPVGLVDGDLAPGGPVLHRGQHAVVLGRPGSGRTTVLRALAHALARSAGPADAPALVVVPGRARSPGLVGLPGDVVAADRLGAALLALAAEGRDALVLVDDADLVADPGGVLQDLSGDGARVHVVAAARTDVVQADYGHWVRRLARSRVGVLLGRDDAAADLLGVRLPRGSQRRVPGRGWLVGDDVEPVQVASPTPVHRDAASGSAPARRSA